MRIATTALILLLGLGVGTWTAELRAESANALERGRSLYGVGQYEKAAEVFAALLAVPLDPKALDYQKRREVYQAARPFYAASLIGSGRVVEADAVILEHLREDPFFQLAPGAFPQPVVERFIAVRSANRPALQARKKQLLEERRRSAVRQQETTELSRKRLALLEKLAAEQVVIERRSRAIAMLPFGIGQFQNGSVGLGVTFAAAQGLGVAATIASGLVANSLAAVNCRLPDPATGQAIDCEELEQQFLLARTINWVSFSTTAALVVAGIVEAQVNFTSTVRNVEKRPIPPPVTVAPVAAPVRGGLLTGVVVRF